MLDFFIKFFNPGYLFSLRPEFVGAEVINLYLWIFGTLAVLAIIFKIFSRKFKNDWLKKNALNKMFNLCLVMGILGLLYTFFIYEGAALLSARFWLLIWLLTFLVWLFFNLRYLFIQIPKRKKEIVERKKFEKYLP